MKIELKFDKSISRLAGNSLGQEIYKQQVEGKIDFSGMTTIVFPEYIEDIAISFIQGFTTKIFEGIGSDEFSDHITIEASEKIKNKFIKAAFF